jgi:YaiO family outer membrane protein
MTQLPGNRNIRLMAVRAALLICACALALGAPIRPAAQETDRTSLLSHVFELGANYSWYDENLGEGDYEFLRYTLSRDQRFIWRVEAGRAARFDDSGLGFGTSLSTFIGGGFFLMAGYGTGTGDFEVFPEYRWDVGIGRSFLKERNLLFSLGYTREQSKIENYYDGFWGNLEYYIDEHWIAGATGRYEVGYPGRNTSTNGGVNLTYSVWKKWALGAGIHGGEVSYQLLAPDLALVDYTRTALMLYHTRYLKSDIGFTSRVDYEHNDLYNLFGITLSVFKEW